MSSPHPSTRRSFLGRLAALGASTPLASTCQTAEGYLIGCYTRPWDTWDLDRALDGIAEAGYRWVGLMTAKGKSWVIITPETSERDAAQAGEKVRQRQLKICSVYGDFSPTPDSRDGQRQLRRLIDNCIACGSPELLLGGTGNPELFDSYFATIASECPYAQSRGIGLTIKPHGGLNATGAACRKVIERVNHPNFRLWYDPGNILYYSDGRRDPLTDVLDVDGLVVGMSVKDFLPPKEVHVTPGTGQVRWPALFARLRLGGFKRGQLLVECTARGDHAQVTAEARKARMFVEHLARGRAFEGLKPQEPY